MFNKNKSDSLLIGVFVYMCASVASTPIHAMNCYDRSPNAQRGQDVYTPIMKNPISDSDSTELFQVFSQAEGKWQGKGVTTMCKERQKNVEAETVEQIVKLDMKRASDKEYRVTFETFDVNKKIRRHYKFVIYRKDKFIDVKNEGNIAIRRLGSADVEFATQSISASIMGGGTQTQTRRISFESVRNLRLSNRRLIFEKAEYFNGAVSNFSQWTFTR